ncbi:TPA: hypothetical protein ACH3X1_013068 [Trebouxia sp. C0004]
MSAFEKILNNSRQKSSGTKVVLSPNSKCKERFELLNGRHLRNATKTRLSSLVEVLQTCANIRRRDRQRNKTFGVNILKDAKEVSFPS